MNNPKERKLEKIVVYKERDYNGILGEIQFWEESDENLTSSMSTGNGWDFKHSTEGLHLGQLRLNSKNVTPKMAKKIAKLLREAFSQSNPKVKVTLISN